MKFKLVKEVDGKVRTYDGSEIETGETVELNDHFSAKALNNPDYKQVKPRGKQSGNKATSG